MPTEAGQPQVVWGLQLSYHWVTYSGILPADQWGIAHPSPSLPFLPQTYTEFLLARVLAQGPG